MPSLKVKEALLKRRADRRGWKLLKSRRRDPDSVDYGLYALIDLESGGAIHAHGPISVYSQTFEQVADWLDSKGVNHV